MGAGWVCDPERLPPSVQQLVARLPDAEARAVCGTDAPADVEIPLESGDLAGVWVLGQLAAASGLPPFWPEDLRRRLAAFAAALPERVERAIAEAARRPFDAERIRRQHANRLARQAQALLVEAERHATQGPPDAR